MVYRISLALEYSPMFWSLHADKRQEMEFKWIAAQWWMAKKICFKLCKTGSLISITSSSMFFKTIAHFDLLGLHRSTEKGKYRNGIYYKLLPPMNSGTSCEALNIFFFERVVFHHWWSCLMVSFLFKKECNHGRRWAWEIEKLHLAVTWKWWYFRTEPKCLCGKIQVSLFKTLMLVLWAFIRFKGHKLSIFPHIPFSSFGW